MQQYPINQPDLGTRPQACSAFGVIAYVQLKQYELAQDRLGR